MGDDFTGFSQRWKNFPDYILGITAEIWEGRGIGTLHDYYAKDIVMRFPNAIVTGNDAVMSGTMATLVEFPDRELLGEDVIWSGDADTGYLSSHRIITSGTHTGHGAFGAPTGKRFSISVIADCAAKEDTIYDEWLIRDYGGLVRQLGHDPRDFAAQMIEEEGGPSACVRPFTPDQNIEGRYQGRGNDNAYGAQYADLLHRIMALDFNVIRENYDRAVLGDYAGGQHPRGWAGAEAFWMGLRSSFPNATFEIHHQIGREDPLMPPRAAIRWSLTGEHDGWGAFGKPSGASVHVMGMCHAEFGPWGLRRETALYDEVSVWKQILMHQG